VLIPHTFSGVGLEEDRERRLPKRAVTQASGGLVWRVDPRPGVEETHGPPDQARPLRRCRPLRVVNSFRVVGSGSSGARSRSLVRRISCRAARPAADLREDGGRRCRSASRPAPRSARCRRPRIGLEDADGEPCFVGRTPRSGPRPAPIPRCGRYVSSCTGGVTNCRFLQWPGQQDMGRSDLSRTTTSPRRRINQHDDIQVGVSLARPSRPRRHPRRSGRAAPGMAALACRRTRAGLPRIPPAGWIPPSCRAWLTARRTRRRPLSSM